MEVLKSTSKEMEALIRKINKSKEASEQASVDKFY